MDVLDRFSPFPDFKPSISHLKIDWFLGLVEESPEVEKEASSWKRRYKKAREKEKAA